MLDSFPMAVMIGILLGFLAGLGIGGGSLLILWLTMVLSIPYSEARGINLLFFLPAAGMSALVRRKNFRQLWKKVLPGIITGCVCAALSTLPSRQTDLTLLKKLFGFLLIFTGIRELRYRPI